MYFVLCTDSGEFFKAQCYLHSAQNLEHHTDFSDDEAGGRGGQSYKNIVCILLLLADTDASPKVHVSCSLEAMIHQKAVKSYCHRY